MHRRTALVSIHDIMPDTLPEVLDIIEVLEGMKLQAVTLLVVPGLNWTEGDLRTLRDLQQAGYELAGHGWTHRCAEIDNVTHRLHSIMMSRQEAEHLSLSAEQIQSLLSRTFHWFHKAGLQPPRLYVPPAWGMGAISKAQLAQLPFQMYEYLGGVFNVERRRFFRMPVLGFLADTAARVWILRSVNGVNSALAGAFGLPLRISIHPPDLYLGLASDLRTTLERSTHFLHYADIFRETSFLSKEVS